MPADNPLNPRPNLAHEMAKRSWIDKWLSRDRFSPYLITCDGDIDRALALYEWNLSLGQVLMRDISHFEVALRNAYNDVMESCWEGESHWLIDEASPVRRPVMRRSASGMLDSNRVNRKTIDAAVRTLPHGYASGDLVANLTLGFWVHLADRSREAAIWRTHLFRAWPRGTRRAELQERTYGILRVRNRVAHGERLFNPKQGMLSPVRVDADAVRLLRLLCPEAAEYLYPDGVAPIEGFLERNPAPANVRLLGPQDGGPEETETLGFRNDGKISE